MAQLPGTVFLSHTAWRIAYPDSEYEQLVLPARCDGDLIVEAYVGDRVTVACNGCTYEVTTEASHGDRDADRHHESRARNEMPF